jgi:hypothetical protein
MDMGMNMNIDTCCDMDMNLEKYQKRIQNSLRAESMCFSNCLLRGQPWYIDQLEQDS